MTLGKLNQTSELFLYDLRQMMEENCLRCSTPNKNIVFSIG